MMGIPRDIDKKDPAVMVAFAVALEGRWEGGSEGSEGEGEGGFYPAAQEQEEEEEEEGEGLGGLDVGIRAAAAAARREYEGELSDDDDFALQVGRWGGRKEMMNVDGCVWPPGLVKLVHVTSRHVSKKRR